MGNSRFRYLISLGTLAALLAGCAGSAAIPPRAASDMVSSARQAHEKKPFSDNFHGRKLNPGWTVESPNPDSSVGLTGHDTLLMRASPKNGGSDLWYTSNYNAPIILQPVSPKLNWTITVKQKFNPTNYFQGAGILLAYQPGNFDSTSQFARISERKDMNDQEVCGAVCVPYAGHLTYLRAVKKGLTYYSYFSADGKTWTSLGSGTAGTAYTWIGLDSMRQPWDNDLSVYSNAYYYYFDVKVGKE